MNTSVLQHPPILEVAVPVVIPQLLNFHIFVGFDVYDASQDFLVFAVDALSLALLGGVVQGF